jgi:hypothetical protein
VDDRAATLEQMARRIEQAGLRAPAAMLLDLLSPLDVISCQLALFTRPLVRGTALYPYADLLTESANWQALRSLIARQ